MSKGFARVPFPLLDDRRLSAVDIAVYAALSSCSSFTTNRARAPYERIAERAHVAKSTARDSVHRLELFGYLHAERKGGRTTRYVLATMGDAAQPTLEGIEGPPSLSIVPNRADSRHVAPKDKGRQPNEPYRQPAGRVPTAGAPYRVFQSQTEQGDLENDENREPATWPEGFKVNGRELDPHAWDHVAPIGSVIDEILEGPDDES